MDLNAPDSNELTLSSADLDLAVIHQKVFNNNLILVGIMKKLLSWTDLANCRLVNKKSWTLVATQRLQMKNWEERKFFSLESVEKMQKYCETYANTKVSRLSSVLFPCLRIRLFHVLLSSTTETQVLALKTICRTFPDQIKSLDLAMGSVQLTPQLVNCVLESQSSSLRELRILYSVSSNSQDLVNSSSYLLTELRYLCLSIFFCTPFPSIQAYNLIEILDLICSKIPRGNPNSVKICLSGGNWPMAETIALLERHQLISAVKFQLLGDTFTNRDCQILAESGVQLEFLRICPYIRSDLHLGICQLLYSQKNSLKTLEWFGETFKFPTYTMNLIKLKLNACKWSGSGGDVEHIPILYEQCFPKLEYLVLTCCNDNRIPAPEFHSMLLAPQFPCVTLQILRLRYCKFNAETVNLISEIFPRLKTLDVGQYKSVAGFEKMFYSAIWSANFASTLEEFAIDLGTSWKTRHWDQFELDSFFSGLNIDQIRQLDFSSDEFYKIQNPSILNFSKLKKLEIFAIGHVKTPGECFTDFSAFTLFGQLKNLEYLHVDEKVHEFTETAIEYMKNQVRILADDQSCTSTERIQKVFHGDWDISVMHDEDKRKSFNLLG